MAPNYRVFELKEPPRQVTGAGKGIGRALVGALRDQGAKVTALSRSVSDLDAIRAEAPDVATVSCDMQDTQALRAAVESLPPQQLVVNNAGVCLGDVFAEATPEDFFTSMNVNVLAAMVVSQATTKKLIDQGLPGSVVNVSSQAGEFGEHGHTVYCASKGALNQLTRAMAVDLGAHGIRTNAVLPTVTMTPMGKRQWGSLENEAKANKLKDRIPLGRFCELDEVVGPILFLLSEQSTMVTGSMLPIDGGFLASPFNMASEDT